METARFIAALERDLAAVAAVGDDKDRGSRRAPPDPGTPRLRRDAPDGDPGRGGWRSATSCPKGTSSSARRASLANPYVGAEPAEPAGVPDEQDGLAARITLRLYESLKRELEAAAAREGMSASNAWLVRALSRSVASPAPRSRAID